MNVEHKVSFAPGREPVSILIIPPLPMTVFFIPDTPQDVLQALAPVGQLWGDAETRQVAQAALDAMYPTWGFTVVIPAPPAPVMAEPLPAVAPVSV